VDVVSVEQGSEIIGLVSAAGGAAARVHGPAAGGGAAARVHGHCAEGLL